MSDKTTNNITSLQDGCDYIYDTLGGISLAYCWGRVKTYNAFISEAKILQIPMFTEKKCIEIFKKRITKTDRFLFGVCVFTLIYMPYHAYKTYKKSKKSEIVTFNVGDHITIEYGFGRGDSEE